MDKNIVSKILSECLFNTKGIGSIKNKNIPDLDLKNKITYVLEISFRNLLSSPTFLKETGFNKHLTSEIIRLYIKFNYSSIFNIFHLLKKDFNPKVFKNNKHLDKYFLLEFKEAKHIFNILDNLEQDKKIIIYYPQRINFCIIGSFEIDNTEIVNILTKKGHFVKLYVNSLTEVVLVGMNASNDQINRAMKLNKIIIYIRKGKILDFIEKNINNNEYVNHLITDLI